jgi:peptide/nickel transport system ATP-binding protein
VSSRPRREPLLSVEGLKVEFWTSRGTVYAVNGISFDIAPGETLGIVGESGCGKSVTSLALLGILSRAGRVTGGTAMFDGHDLLTMKDDALRKIRGRDIAMIFQDPMTSLNPVLTIGRQIREALETHFDLGKKEANARAAELLDRVGIPSPKARLKDYPHQFSGGMRQRAMIAMALSCNPELLIADEPTTALDVTVQAQILDLISDLQAEFGSAVIIITHDLGVVAELADDVLVMYAGKVVEYASAEDVFERPEHPYTWGLLSSMPRLDRERADRLMPIRGTPPSLINLPTGCAFHPRCPYAELNGGRSTEEVPPLRAAAPAHLVACHLPASERRRLWASEIKPSLDGSARAREPEEAP